MEIFIRYLGVFLIGFGAGVWFVVDYYKIDK